MELILILACQATALWLVLGRGERDNETTTFAGQSSLEGAAEKPHQSACEAAGGANTTEGQTK
jgi:hypothetical protein